jgi:hypothetical protein
MEAQLALEIFLKGVLTWRRERYLGFINKPNTQTKFLETIYHILEGDLDISKAINKLPSKTTPIPGYWFAPPNEFGISVIDIQEFCNSHEDSFLVISQDGQFGIHSPETFIDSRVIYKI